MPYASLSTQAITVRVHTLRAACVRCIRRPSPDLSDPNMKPYWEFIYTMKALGGC